MKFVADCMLGRLAKWLRVLGFDVVYFAKAEDRELVALSKQDGRTLLTRDSGLCEKSKIYNNRLFIESSRWEEQVVQVLDTFKLWNSIKPQSRCLICNLKLKQISKEKAKNLVSLYVFERASEFAVCPGCGRVFWRGSHSGNMESKIDSILKKQIRKRGVR